MNFSKSVSFPFRSCNLTTAVKHVLVFYLSLLVSQHSAAYLLALKHLLKRCLF
jgi:hypothetical protein